MATDRKYSLTLFGATGFTGGLTADYLAANLPEGTVWAIAGRNAGKLESVVTRLRDAGSSTLPDVMVADIGDAISLKDMAEVSKVVITTVGPYVWYGEGLVEACVDAGTHYCDLTGEPEFVNNMISRYHGRACASGAAIVNCCGFDSIPHDAGAFFSVGQLAEALGHPLSGPVTVEGVVSASGTFSGGTWQSALTAFGRPLENRSAMRHARSVIDTHYPKRARLLPMRPRKDQGFGGWICPMPTIDPYMVVRSARAVEGYGDDFRYGHFLLTGSLPKLAGGVAAVGGLLAAAQVRFVREKLLQYRQSGDGPSAEKRASSWFKVHFRASAQGQVVETLVSGGDPGYDETAKMLAETAMGLALDKDKPCQSGVITPVMALEQCLVDRLIAAGMDFKRVR